MANLRHLKVVSGGGKRKGTETERLDSFLDRVADAGLLHSLREDEVRRRRWLFALAALILGLLLGGGGMWLFLREGPVAAAESAEAEARILVSQGQELMRAKEIDKAWVDLRLATRLAPDLVDAWDALAMSGLYGGQTVEAERALRKCLEINPEHSRAHHLMGDVHFYAGDGYDEARASWEKAGARRPIARVGLLEGRLADVAPLIRQLAREMPDDRYVRVMSEALGAGRLTPELRLLLEPHYVLSRNPDTALGWRLFYQRRYEEASATFSRALHREPRDGSALNGRGWCLLRMGGFREAQSDFEQVLATWPSNYSALNGLAWSRKAQGQTEGAMKLWERVLELPHVGHIEIPESLKGLGLVSYERGDYGQANLYLTKSLLLNPHDPQTRTLLEDTLRRLSGGG